MKYLCNESRTTASASISRAHLRRSRDGGGAAMTITNDRGVEQARRHEGG